MTIGREIGGTLAPKRLTHLTIQGPRRSPTGKPVIIGADLRARCSARRLKEVAISCRDP